jgi:Chlorophyll A-B binding protein
VQQCSGEQNVYKLEHRQLMCHACYMVCTVQCINRMKLAELKNGRGAMIVFAAFLAHDLIPGSVPFWPFPW